MAKRQVKKQTAMSAMQRIPDRLRNEVFADAYKTDSQLGTSEKRHPSSATMHYPEDTRVDSAEGLIVTGLGGKSIHTRPQTASENIIH